MKRIIFFLIVVVCFSPIYSCKKDFLEVVDSSELTRQGYVKDLNSTNEYLTGTYVLFSQYSNYAMSSVYPELVADNLKPLPSPPQFLMSQYSWSQQKEDSPGYLVAPTALNMNAFWRSSYFIIRACNFVIEDVDKYKNENPVKANQIKGEALALRALLHFGLVNVFSQTYAFTSQASHPGVPYITDSDLTAPFKRQSVAEVYNSMIVDLKAAIQLLPSVVSDIRHLNLLAAQALLARIYLYKGDFSGAKDMARSVMEKVPLSTVANGYPDAMFSDKLPIETEVLFQATPGDAISSTFMGRYLKGAATFFIATDEIASLLQENMDDVRSKWVTRGSDRWSVNKFPSNVAGLRSIPEADYYQPIIRSSEMFLTASEACARTGDEVNSRIYLNAIRRRSNSTIPAVTASGGALIDSIYKERRKELSFEGLRMYDLQRWQLGVHRKDASSGNASVLPYPSSKAIAPIPISDVMLAGLPQNIDY